jgi:ArsR family transcriptional regulator
VIASTTIELRPDEACQLLAVVADPVRFDIVRQLAGGRRCVCDLQSNKPIAANLLSYHLRVLREADLVAAFRRGRWVDYELAPGAPDRLSAAFAALLAPGGGAER